MEIILLEQIEKLGKVGEVVTVKNGYARNFLLPTAKALRATKANLEYFENQKKEIEAKNAKILSNAEEKFEKLKDYSLVLIRQAAETGQLYGSVTVRDLAAAFHSDDIDIKKSQISLEKAIKDLGVYEVKIKVHPTLIQTVKVNIARTEDEAKSQAGA